MTDLPAPVATAFEAHDAFTQRDERSYALETTVFETDVTANPAEGPRDGAFTVVVTVPTLGAVTDDHVARVVEDGWFDTLERRLEDTFSVAQTSTHESPVVERDLEAGEVTVTLEYVAWNAREGVDDAKTVIEYVEGTYAQGIIPGYDYRGPAATLLEGALQAGQEAAGEADGDIDSNSGGGGPQL